MKLSTLDPIFCSLFFNASEISVPYSSDLFKASSSCSVIHYDNIARIVRVLNQIDYLACQSVPQLSRRWQPTSSFDAHRQKRLVHSVLQDISFIRLENIIRFDCSRRSCCECMSGWISVGRIGQDNESSCLSKNLSVGTKYPPGECIALRLRQTCFLNPGTERHPINC